MPYLKVWIHLIWSTKNREPLLTKDLREKLFEHIKKNAMDKTIYLDIIGGYVDHVHTLISLRGDQSISKVAMLLKGESSYWINEHNLTPANFQWQEEYIAVSVSESIIENVRAYIRNQEAHHRTKSFSEEHEEFLKKYEFEHGGLKPEKV